MSSLRRILASAVTGPLERAPLACEARIRLSEDIVPPYSRIERASRPAASRIVQYKMILKQDLIPIQDDRETVKRRCVRRPDANAHAERRIADRSETGDVAKTC